LPYGYLFFEVGVDVPEAPFDFQEHVTPTG
jgi:hypothetical protein